MVGIEHGSMTLARMAGLDVAETQLALPLNKKVILVKRFDRVVSETSVYRRHMISAMTKMRDKPRTFSAGNDSAEGGAFPGALRSC
jgi:hypothetical protein